jgi:hypothetical protein
MRRAWAVFFALCFLATAVMVSGESEVEELSIGRRGKASTIRRAMVSMGTFTTPPGTFQGNFEEMGEEEQLGEAHGEHKVVTVRVTGAFVAKGFKCSASTQHMSDWIKADNKVLKNGSVSLTADGKAVGARGQVESVTMNVATKSAKKKHYDDRHVVGESKSAPAPAPLTLVHSAGEYMTEDGKRCRITTARGTLKLNGMEMVVGGCSASASLEVSFIKMTICKQRTAPTTVAGKKALCADHTSGATGSNSNQPVSDKPAKGSGKGLGAGEQNKNAPAARQGATRRLLDLDVLDALDEHTLRGNKEDKKEDKKEDNKKKATPAPAPATTPAPAPATKLAATTPATTPAPTGNTLSALSQNSLIGVAQEEPSCCDVKKIIVACTVSYVVPLLSPPIVINGTSYTAAQTVTQQCANNHAANVWSVQVV